MLIRSIVAAAVVAALAGCAANPPASREERVAAAEENDCIWLRTISDWQALDDRNLIVEGAGRQQYHVELAQTCSGLRFETVLAFYDRTGDERICGFGMDRVIVDNTLPETCWISAVDALTEDQAEELTLRYERDRAARRD
jgi:hypothetical protein